MVAMSRPFGQFSVALGELRAGLLAAAQRAGVSPSVLARQAIAVELERRQCGDQVREAERQRADAALMELLAQQLVVVGRSARLPPSPRRRRVAAAARPTPLSKCERCSRHPMPHG